MASYARLGLSIPEPPKFDSTTQQVIQTFILADRARKYIDGQALRLSVRDVTDVIEVHPIDMPRSILDYIIFSIDDIVLNEQRTAHKDKPEST